MIFNNSRVLLITFSCLQINKKVIFRKKISEVLGRKKMCFLVLSASTIFRSLFLNTSFCKTDILTLFLIHIFSNPFLMLKFQPHVFLQLKLKKNKSFSLNLHKVISTNIFLCVKLTYFFLVMTKLSQNKPNKVEI